MKAQCEVEKIKDAIWKTERITGKNLTLPVLNSLLLIASGKSIKLRATNLSLGIEAEIPAKVEKEGIVAVAGSVLAGVFSNIFQNENAELESLDGNLSIKTQKSRISLKGQSHDDFPTIPAVTGTSFEIEAKKLVEGIKSVSYSSSPSDIKPEISSVFLYAEDGQLRFVATDSFRLAEKKIKVKGLPDIPGILIPFRNIPDILRVLGELNEEVKVCFNKNQISFTAHNVYLTSRVLDGIFPDYRQIIPKNRETKAIVLKQDLLNALKLSNVFSDKWNQLNLSVRPKEKIFELSSANNDVGENKTYLDGALEGENLELSFNYKYFLDCFQSLGADSISISLNHSGKPMVIEGVGDSSFLYLIMPMNPA